MQVDFVPEVFGRLTTVGPGVLVAITEKGQRATYCPVRCECGTEKLVRRGSLLAGDTQSCGCLQKQRTSEAKTTHGHCKDGKLSPEYIAWNNMVDRCTNPKNKDRRNYGGRGVGIFPEWLGPTGFETWYAHIGPIPRPGMTQDRYPNKNGNYEPGNVRWATTKEQGNNRRNNVLLTHNGETKTVAQWVESTGIYSNTIRNRLLRGWSVERTLTQTPRKQNKAI